MSEYAMSASFGDRTIYFTDGVVEGEVVDVYTTMDDAENERGPFVKCRVDRDSDGEWLLKEAA